MGLSVLYLNRNLVTLYLIIVPGGADMQVSADCGRGEASTMRAAQDRDRVVNFMLGEGSSRL